MFLKDSDVKTDIGHNNIILREMEKDKLRLSLKHLPLRRLDKMIMRLEELLGKIPTGEVMHRTLLKEQAVLQDNYNNSTLSAGLTF